MGSATMLREALTLELFISTSPESADTVTSSSTAPALSAASTVVICPAATETCVTT
jgi:hypothetical protein